MSAHRIELECIDNALESYYKNNGYFSYRDNNGIGLFMRYIIDEQLDDPEIPIEDELGDDCNPTHCSYTWTKSYSSFPIPNDIEIPDKYQEEYIFYILQYCYKYHVAPSSHHIKANIISKVNGKIKAEARNDGIAVDEFINNNNKFEGRKVIKRMYKKPFIAKYSARAHLNIFTSKDLTKMLMDMILEPFDDELHVYYYTDISTALQMNDNQVNEYCVLINNCKEYKFGIINYDFHLKETGESLYGIFIPNDDCKVQQDKWLWKLDSFLTGKEILNKYDVAPSELPLSSREMSDFRKELEYKFVINNNNYYQYEAIIDSTDWFGIKQIKSLKRSIKMAKVSITLNKEMFIKECKKSFDEKPLIPVVVNKNNKHWIEWIKIIYISSQNIYVGISFKYIVEINNFQIESICLDRGDIYNKHRLVGIIDNKYISQLKYFKTSITEIIFSDNKANDIDSKMNTLKQQITLQQNSIVRLKESLLRVKNQKKMMVNNNISDPLSISQEIQDLIDDDDNNMMNDEYDELRQIVDDVIKKYDVLPFKTSPIGAKRNIYINKQFTSSWSNYVFPRFSDECSMYYWLDYTTAIQMIQCYAKQYVDKKTKSFLIAIINYELRDNYNNNLYGIICRDIDKNKNDNNYPYKLLTLMSSQQIHKEFGINSYDLPPKSRKHAQFVSKLVLKRKICKEDINCIKWTNLKLFKSQSTTTTTTTNRNDNKSVTMTRNVMKEYINIDLERMNNNLIPIMVVDKHNNYYGIDWVLIVNIIHRNCNVGVSFRFNQLKNIFIAKSIYLDKAEIQSKHKLIGLKYNYCQNIPSFSVKKLKFKLDKNVIIDDDDDDYNHNSAIIKYKQLIQNEKLKNQQLQQQLFNQQQQYMQQIQILKQQNQQNQTFYDFYQQPQCNNNNININPYYYQY